MTRAKDVVLSDETQDYIIEICLEALRDAGVDIFSLLREEDNIATE